MHVDCDLAEIWQPYDRQARFITTPALYSLFLGGVGSGKSHALTCWVIARALANDGALGALLGRTTPEIRTILLPHLMARLEEMQEATGVCWLRNYNKGDAKLTLINGSSILLRPYNRIAKVRSLTLTFAAADEVAWSEADPDEVWSVFTGRLRGKGPAPGLGFATSPNGLHGIVKRFVEAQRSYADAVKARDLAAIAKWSAYHVTTTTSHDNPYNPPHFYEALGSMSKKRHAQEVLGKVLRPSHTVWQLEKHHIIPWHWPAHRDLLRVYGVDWGGQGHHVAVMFQVDHHGRWVAADELVCDDMPRGQFQQRLHQWIESHGKEPPALICVDRAVPAENQILQAHFRSTPVRWMEKKEDQQVRRGIELVRDLMDPYDAEPSIYWSASLAQTVSGDTAPIIPAMRGYVYHLDNQGQPTDRPRKDNTNDHICDALRYAVMGSALMPNLHGGKRLQLPPAAPVRHEKALQAGNSGRLVH